MYHMAQASQSKTSSVQGMDHAIEYRIIRHDLVRLLILNLLYLALVLGVYYTDKTSHYLQKFADRFIHF